MKKLLLILILTSSISSFAQDSGRKERIKALKKALAEKEGTEKTVKNIKKLVESEND